jgi:acyl transferase domain-containing protein
VAAVSLPAEELRVRLAPFGSRLALAVDNGPASTVVSGEPAAVDELVKGLQQVMAVGMAPPTKRQTKSPPPRARRAKLVPRLSGRVTKNRSSR